MVIMSAINFYVNKRTANSIYLVKLFVLLCYLFTPAIINGNPVTISGDELLSENLRLSAMGNIVLVIEDITNRINISDFGELGAGLIEENNRKPNLYIPDIIAFDMTEEEFEQSEWFAEKIGISSTVQFNTNNIMGVSLKRYTRRSQYYSWTGMSYVKETEENIYDTLTFCHKFGNFASAVRGGYEIREMKFDYFNEPRCHQIDIIYGEPSFLFKSRDNHWVIGLGYQYEKCGHHDDAFDRREKYLFHIIKLPTIYSDSVLNLGMNFNYQLLKPDFDSLFQNGGLVRIQTRYKIGFEEKYLTIGFLSEYENVAQFDSRRYIEGRNLKLALVFLI